jgi:hypothetical protein
MSNTANRIEHISPPFHSYHILSFHCPPIGSLLTCLSVRVAILKINYISRIWLAIDISKWFQIFISTDVVCMVWSDIELIAAVGTIGSAINANRCQLLSTVVHLLHSVAHCWHTSCQQGAILRGDLQPANQTNMGNILQQYLVLVLLFLLMTWAVCKAGVNILPLILSESSTTLLISTWTAQSLKVCKGPDMLTFVNYATTNERTKLACPVSDNFTKGRLDWVPEFEGAKSWYTSPH